MILKTQAGSDDYSNALMTKCTGCAPFCEHIPVHTVTHHLSYNVYFKKDMVSISSF